MSIDQHRTDQVFAVIEALAEAGAAEFRPGHIADNLREAVTLIGALALAWIVWGMLPELMAGARPAVTVSEVLPGISIAFRAEPLGMLFAALASSLWIVNSIYSIGYMRGNNEGKQTRFYTCFALALAATMGVAFAANLFTLFLFYELLTLSTYPLVAHKGDAATVRSARVYLGIGSNIERERYITAGLDALQGLFHELALSSVYHSEAVGFEGQPFVDTQ